MSDSSKTRIETAPSPDLYRHLYVTALRAVVEGGGVVPAQTRSLEIVSPMEESTGSS